MSAATAEPHDDQAIHAALDALRRESEARTAELREIAVRLPQAVGRRAMLRALVGDALTVANRGQLVRKIASRVFAPMRALARRCREALVRLARRSPQS